MTTRLQTLRNRAFEQQQGLCYYCDLPMWHSSAQPFANKHRISIKAARQFECTAEHLEAKSAGGATQLGIEEKSHRRRKRGDRFNGTEPATASVLGILHCHLEYSLDSVR